jgi:hypothetical protein
MPVLDKVTNGEVPWVVIVDQSETANHGSENNTPAGGASQGASVQTIRHRFLSESCQVGCLLIGDNYKRREQRRANGDTWVRSFPGWVANLGTIVPCHLGAIADVA